MRERLDEVKETREKAKDEKKGTPGTIRPVWGRVALTEISFK